MDAADGLDEELGAEPVQQPGGVGHAQPAASCEVAGGSAAGRLDVQDELESAEGGCLLRGRLCGQRFGPGHVGEDGGAQRVRRPPRLRARVPFLCGRGCVRAGSGSGSGGRGCQIRCRVAQRQDQWSRPFVVKRPQAPLSLLCRGRESDGVGPVWSWERRRRHEHEPGHAVAWRHGIYLFGRAYVFTHSKAFADLIEEQVVLDLRDRLVRKGTAVGGRGQETAGVAVTVPGRLGDEEPHVFIPVPAGAHCQHGQAEQGTGMVEPRRQPPATAGRAAAHPSSALSTPGAKLDDLRLSVDASVLPLRCAGGWRWRRPIRSSGCPRRV